jgi:hypothetical protein
LLPHVRASLYIGGAGIRPSQELHMKYLLRVMGIVGCGGPVAAQNTDSKSAVGRLRFVTLCGNLYYWAIDVIGCAALQFSAVAASRRPTLTSGFCQ